MDRWLQDVRYGLRMAVRDPAFATVLVLTLAVGTGATTAVFSVVHAVLLNPLPYPNTNRIVTVWQSQRTAPAERDAVAPGNFLDWRDRATTFDVLATYEAAGLEFLTDEEPLNLRIWRVSEGFFDVFGVSPLRGRTFVDDEHLPGRGDVVILTHGFWQRQFGGNTGIVGTSMTLNGRPHVVVGIMPEEFDFPPGRDLWAPRAFTEKDRQVRGRTFLNVVGLLKPGATTQAAYNELTGIADRLGREHPTTNSNVGVAVVDLRERIVGDVRPYLILLTGAVTLVLLLTCVNAANLLIARGASRLPELAVRTALGASRDRLFSQLIVETVVLALVGGVFGILGARWALQGLLALAPADVPRLQEAGLNGRVLLFALSMTCAAAVLFGLLPARKFARVGSEAVALREAPRGGGRAPGDRTRRLLVVTQVAVAVTLLVGTALLLRSFVNLLRVDPGFSTQNVITMPVFVWGRYPTEPRRAAFFRETITRMESVPGVMAAGAVSYVPFSEALDNTDTSLSIEGRTIPTDALPTVMLSVATPGYFRAMGIATVRGRDFTAFDTSASTPVALVNETLVRRLFANEDPLRQQIQISSGPRVTWEIVGVVRDVRDAALDVPPRPAVFIPHEQYPVGSMTFVARTSADPATTVGALKAAVWVVNKDLPFRAITTTQQLVASSIAPRQFILVLMGAFGAIGLFLSAVGVFGIVHYLATQRTQEVGVRVALGASPSSIVRSFVGEGLRITAIGIIAGVSGALALTQLLARLLFGITRLDPIAFVSVVLLILLIAAISSYLPARRAARLNPVIALRNG